MSANLGPHLGELFARLDPRNSALLHGLAQQLCTALDEGHVCLPPLDASTRDALAASSLAGVPGEEKPLILDPAGRLYLHRYWSHQEQLATALLARATATPEPVDAALARTLDGAQRDAVEKAARSLLSILTGGPGTGKTRTATMVLAIFAEHFARSGRAARIALAAPTGKAAARLGEALQHTLATLPLSPAARALLPQEPATLHRLLGARPGSPDFRHSAENPLPHDLLIVDEASMVDLPLMSRFFAATRPDARILLLGDKDQLASVEAGHVLGDICAARGPLSACITTLERNYRFGSGSGIHRLSQAVRAGDTATALALLGEKCDDLCASPLPELGALAPLVVREFRTYLSAPTPELALEQFGHFRILAATRHGEAGVENLNALTEAALAAAGLIAPQAQHYEGQPVLIRRNDYQLRLFNGDIGILRRDASGSLRAYFQSEDGLRAIAPARLPEHETAYAMTIHKSQGSEFRRLLCVLPPGESRILSRELLYTAITRARDHVELWHPPRAIEACTTHTLARTSGLSERLGGG